MQESSENISCQTLKKLFRRIKYKFHNFYPRGASDARELAIIVCLFVCVCVCVSHAGIVSKRLNGGSPKQHRMIAQGL